MTFNAVTALALVCAAVCLSQSARAEGAGPQGTAGQSPQGLPPGGPMAYPQGPVAVPGNINVGPIEKIQSLTAGPDGTAWGVTSSGRLFFCRVQNSPSPHISCYDDKGPFNVNSEGP